MANGGKVSGLELVRCTSVFDEQGKFCPYFDDAKTTVAADQVILAIGQASETAFCKDFCFLDDQQSLPVEKGLIAVDKKTQETAIKGVFAGGDAANGPATVIEAIAAGRRAAVSIDKYLGGNGVLEVGSWKAEGGSEGSANAEAGSSGCGNGYDGRREARFADLKRVDAPTLPVAERNGGFGEVELCFRDEQALEETRRCLQCDLEICLAKAKRS